MDSKNNSKANLKKYTKVDGKWRFVPVLKQDGVPYPGTVVIDGKPMRSTTGTFYLEFYENGRRVQRPVGSSPREAKDAWNQHCNPDKESASILAEEENAGPELTTIATAFEHFLEEARATKEPATYRAYRRDLKWVAAKLGARLVSKVTRHDLLRVMGQGREEDLDPKTINRKLIVALMALRNAGAVIEMKKGDWPKVTEPIVEIYEPKELVRFFRACTPLEKLLFEAFLCTGFGKREIATMTWNDRRGFVNSKSCFKVMLGGSCTGRIQGRSTRA